MSDCVSDLIGLGGAAKGGELGETIGEAWIGGGPGGFRGSGCDRIDADP